MILLTLFIRIPMTHPHSRPLIPALRMDPTICMLTLLILQTRTNRHSIRTWRVIIPATVPRTTCLEHPFNNTLACRSIPVLRNCDHHNFYPFFADPLQLSECITVKSNRSLIYLYLMPLYYKLSPTQWFVNCRKPTYVKSI